MKFGDIIKISFSNLFRQKLRTILTIISIVIGTTLISIVYSVIPGVNNFLNLQFETLSSPRMIEIYATPERPGEHAFGGLGSGPQEYEEGDGGGSRFDLLSSSFKDEDIESIKSIDGVENYYDFPMPSVKYLYLEEQGKKYSSSFVMYYPPFLLENLEIVVGRKLTDNDKAKAVVSYQYLGSFGIDNPDDIIGKKLIMNVEQTSQDIESSIGMPQDIDANAQIPSKEFEFEIVGVSEKTMLSSVIYVPFEDALEMTKFARGTEEVLTDNDPQRFVGVVEINNPERAEEILEKIEELGFSGMTYEQSKNVVNDILGVLTVIFSSFGVLAIAVSSFGILNTLVMAVYERTREIGILKAIGARKMHIAVLFTIEAALIGFIGGIIGLILGFGVSEILNFLGHKTFLSSFETLDLSNITPLLLLAPVISTVVATIAGIYPAFRASRLDPVKAIRFE